MLCSLVECVFGRLKSKFKILHSNDKFNDAELFPMLIKVLCALHNFLSREEGKDEPLFRGSWCSDAEEDAFEQEMLWMNPLPPVGAAQGAQHDNRGRGVRDKLRRHVALSKQHGLSKTMQEEIMFH